jgi:hypothetical protein
MISALNSSLISDFNAINESISATSQNYISAPFVRAAIMPTDNPL